MYTQGGFFKTLHKLVVLTKLDKKRLININTQVNPFETFVPKFLQLHGIILFFYYFNFS